MFIDENQLPSYQDVVYMYICCINVLYDTLLKFIPRQHIFLVSTPMKRFEVKVWNYLIVNVR